MFYLFTYTAAIAQYHIQSPATRIESSSAARESIVSGTAQQLHSTKSGSYLLVNTPQGSFNAPLGTRLSPEIQKSLSDGATAQVTGVIKTIFGKQTFLVRQLTVAGETIAVRNDNELPGLYTHSFSF